MLADASFVIVTVPGQGQRLGSPFEVEGCSRTFESTVEWTLRARDGRVLAEGHTMGGGVDGAAPFRASVSYDVGAPEVGSLHVAAPDPSDGEGPPPVRTVIPVVLAP